MPETDLLTPRAAARAKELEFFARTRVEGFLKSINRSKLKGHSTDFMQHRQYMPGDSLRSIDWRVFARSDRLVTREYEEYTNLGVVIGVDFSGSMGYKGRGPTKIDFCRHCAAMLCYLLLSQRDSFGLAAMTDTIVRYLRPAGDIRAAYQEVCAEHTQRLRDGANRFRIDFNSIPVTEDWDAALAALLRKRTLLT